MTYPRDCAHCGKRVLRPNGMFMALLWRKDGPVALHHACVREYFSTRLTANAVSISLTPSGGKP